jgi:hypothetical protein
MAQISNLPSRYLYWEWGVFYRAAIILANASPPYTCLLPTGCLRHSLSVVECSLVSIYKPWKGSLYDGNCWSSHKSWSIWTPSSSLFRSRFCIFGVLHPVRKSQLSDKLPGSLNSWNRWSLFNQDGLGEFNHLFWPGTAMDGSVLAGLSHSKTLALQDQIFCIIRSPSW